MKSVTEHQKTATNTSMFKVKKGASCTKSGRCSTKSGRCNTKTMGLKQKISGKNSVHSTKEKESISYTNPVLSPPFDDMGTSYQKPATKFSALNSEHGLKPVAKVRLQFFPIDEATHGKLHKGGHNPYLELTLGVGKKISSVVKHLNAKWGNADVAVGELVLFPYEAHLENLAAYGRWTVEDTGIRAGDVYKAVGSPDIFRLRYGWFIKPNKCNENVCLDANKEHELMQTHDLMKLCPSLHIPVDGSAERQVISKRGICTGVLLSDGLTNLSFSDILAGVSPATIDANQCNNLPMEGSSRLPQMPFNYDSFDAAIASHLAHHQAPNHSFQLPKVSILDAEETCHAFSFQKNSSSTKELAPLQPDHASCNCEPFSEIKVCNQVGYTCYNSPDEAAICLLPHKQDESCKNLHAGEQLQNNSENSLGLAGINWDSLGPLEHGMLLKQISGDESITFSSLFGNSQDASRSHSVATGAS